ncbi:MAG: DUF3618 domain-containing protein [Phycisphaeraceae bacterium]
MAAREGFLNENNPPPRGAPADDVREELAEHRERQEKRAREHLPERVQQYRDEASHDVQRSTQRQPGRERETDAEHPQHIAVDARDRERERELTPHLAQKREHAQEQARRERERKAQHEESSDEIRDDINLTRARLDQTIDTLQLRLTPRYMAQQTMDKIKHRSTRAGNRFTRLVRENPMPAMVSGLGLAWLIGAGMRSRKSSQPRGGRQPATPYDTEVRARQNLYEAGMESQGSAYPPPEQYAYESEHPSEGRSEGMTQKASEYGEQAREKASEYGEQAKRYGQQAKQKAGEYGQQIREQAGEMGEHLRSGTHQVSEKASDLFERHPLSVGLGIMAAGLALGMLLPATRRENEMLGKQRDKLFRQAKTYGSDLAERGQAVAQRATEAAKEAASEEGLSAEQASKEGEDVARRAGDVAAEAGKAAREEAKQQGLTGEEKQSKRPGGDQSQS